MLKSPFWPFELTFAFPLAPVLISRADVPLFFASADPSNVQMHAHTQRIPALFCLLLFFYSLFSPPGTCLPSCFQVVNRSLLHLFLTYPPSRVQWHLVCAKGAPALFSSPRCSPCQTSLVPIFLSESVLSRLDDTRPAVPARPPFSLRILSLFLLRSFCHCRSGLILNVLFCPRAQDAASSRMFLPFIRQYVLFFPLPSRPPP